LIGIGSITQKYHPTNIWKTYLPVNKLNEPTSLAWWYFHM
jgi:hypothetical protein